VRARIWGCRGSLATPGRDTVTYGGNTSCLEVSLDDGTRVILDAGTGIRTLGIRLARDEVRTIHLCLTHLHLDHLEGFGFFAPIWRPETEVHVWGPPSSMRTLHQRIARYFSPPLFPMQLTDVPARLSFHDVTGGEWEIGGLRVRAALVSHPGPTLGYRLDCDAGSLAYIPDHEPALGVGLRMLSPAWISGFELAEGVDVLLHDAQYTEAEYESKLGWGHSSVADAVSFAELTGARRLLLFHHDPLRSDSELEQLGTRAGELWDGSGAPPELAFEGMEIALDSVS
jgi:phosphoribosyl 1,2-cyclic phosphodiesterase